MIDADGVPDHATGTFPNASNPNTIEEQDYEFTLPVDPRLASATTDIPSGGPIGITRSGVPFYGPETATGLDAVLTEVFDSCAGHPDGQGAYHYHQRSSCLPAGSGHSPVLAFAFDGFSIFGLNDTGGAPPTNLDGCNGHRDAERGYDYHVTEDFPYVLGCYAGEVEEGNLDSMQGGGGPLGGGPPPM